MGNNHLRLVVVLKAACSRNMLEVSSTDVAVTVL